MKTIMLGWSHLRRSEKGVMLLAIFVALSLSCLSVIQGSDVISAKTIGPLVLMAAVVQSTTMTGIMRMRSLALNHVLVETLKKLREVTGKDIPENLKTLLAKFLGDKK